MIQKGKDIIFKNKINAGYAIHMVLLLLMAAGIAYFSNAVILENAWNKRYFLLAGILLAVLMLCSFVERREIYDSFRKTGILAACFLVSGLLLLLSDYYVNLPVWLIGGILAAALVSRNIGMLYLYFFVFHAIYLQGNWRNGLVFHFVIATVIAFLIPKMKTFLSMFYMMVLTSCLILIGSVVHNNMVMESGMLLDTFYILCTYLVCIFVTMLLVKWTGMPKGFFSKKEKNAQNTYAYLEWMAADTAEKDAEIDKAMTQQGQTEEPTLETADEAVPVEEVAAKEPTAEAVSETVTETALEKEVVLEKATSETADEPVLVEEPVPTEKAVPEETKAKTVSVEEVATKELTAEAVIETVTEVVPEEATSETAKKPAPVEESILEEPDYTPYCDEKSELLLTLRAKNRPAYAQAVLVGKLASETAKAIGLNAELTKAGGLYRRIGKIKDESDDFSSAEIAKEHNFPPQLIYLLEQLNHNIIEQKEAALLLITDGVISYYSIVRHVQKNDIPVEKIVDTIVSKKIFQGEFNETALSMQECFLLREKLITLLKNQDRRQVSQTKKE